MDTSGQRLFDQVVGKYSLQKTAPRVVHEHLALGRMDYSLHALANGYGAPGIS